MDQKVTLFCKISIFINYTILSVAYNYGIFVVHQLPACLLETDILVLHLAHCDTYNRLDCITLLVVSAFLSVQFVPLISQGRVRV